MPRERKSLSSRLLVKDAAAGELTAVFANMAPGVVDLDGDEYGPGALRSGVDIPVSPWNHSSSMTGGPLPVGKAAVRTVGTEAVAEIEYFMDLDRGREAFEVVRKLRSVQWSWLLDIRDAEPGKIGRRRILDVAALEVSPVVQAAGLGTRTLETRGVDALAEAMRFERFRFRSGLVAS